MLALQNIFDSYASASYGASIGSNGIDGTRFLKFCKDVEIFDNSAYRKEDVDVVFAKFKEPSCNYLSFKGFRDSIAYIAKKLHVPAEELFKYIIKVNPEANPHSSPKVTIPLPNRFHDDVNLYTGTHRLKFAILEQESYTHSNANQSRNIRRSQSNDTNRYRQQPSPSQLHLGPSNPSPYLGLYDKTPPSSASPRRSQSPTHRIPLGSRSMDEYRSPKPILATSSSSSSSHANYFTDFSLPLPTPPSSAASSHSQSPPSTLGAPPTPPVNETLEASLSPSPSSLVLGRVHSLDRSSSKLRSRSASLLTEPPSDSFSSSNEELQQQRKPPSPAIPLQNTKSVDFLHSPEQPPSPDREPRQPDLDPLRLQQQEVAHDLDKRELQAIFEEYIFGSQLGVDGARFLKFCKDFQLFDQSFRHVDVDVVFAKFKENGQRYLSFRGFLLALEQIAKRRRVPPDLLLDYVMRNSHCASRISGATVLPIPTRFHDDPSSYTGVHRAGGPTVVDRNIKDLSRMVDRSVVEATKVSGTAR